MAGRDQAGAGVSAGCHSSEPASRRAGCPALLLLLCLLGSVAPVTAALPLDESPAQPGEWGYHPAQGTAPAVNPPAFSWRPQEDVVRWELELSAEEDFVAVIYRGDNIMWNVHTPPQPLPAGQYYWRYRGRTADGELTAWSRTRQFQTTTTATVMPLPPREELLARIPDSHPRLFVRPEDLPRLRELARGELRDIFARIETRCERLLADPPPTGEPPKYGADVQRKSEEWRKIWWGNRTYTIAALNGAATLGFAWQITGREDYGELAKKILLACAAWDPVGATGYRYNDEAGMPYAYHFARTYTFIHDLLSASERDICREVLTIRGREMYRHLCPRHLWRPYSSHSNRAWHFLGEVGIALRGELPEADDWVWFAVNVFYNVYPVWSDTDGGWHEGFSYWNSYLSRFTWWADVMHSALDIDAYQKPFFSQMGYFPIYLLPPHKVGGGFGDLNAQRTAGDARTLMSHIAPQAANGHWQWYVDRLGGPPEGSDPIAFLRAAANSVAPQPPTDLPTSRRFAGTGIAVLNTSLEDAKQSVQVLFKSSPFGTQSHGYEANNAFLLWAYGQRLLVRSGYRDIYGSAHHSGWMWSTRSVNNITVGGKGQLKHSAESQGRIVDFHTTPQIDVVVGEAGTAYREWPDTESILNRFTRAIVFLKPDHLVIYDRLQAKQPEAFEYHLHSPHQFQIIDPGHLQLRAGDVRCDIALLMPAELHLSQTDQYDPNPRPRITLREWHLTATTTVPAAATEFVAIYRIQRGAETDRASSRPQATCTPLAGGYRLQVMTPGGTATLLLPADDKATLRHEELAAQGTLSVRWEPAAGQPTTLHAAME